MILEAIYEPGFSVHSHGFRPRRSCHTALKEIELTFKSAKWIIEGDIQACFDSFDHHMMIEILRRRIHDEHLIGLIWKFLKAGYMEQWEYHNTYSGTPQGSGMSPILANIYLSEFDAFVENYKAGFTIGEGDRKVTKEYGSAIRQCRRLRLSIDGAEDKAQTVKKFKLAQKELLNTPCYPAIDPAFKRMQYNRYADDFVIGVIGSKADAEQVKHDIKAFLADKLKLTLSEEKTKVTHSGKMVRYLGYDFTISRSGDTKRTIDGVLKRLWYGAVRLYLPYDKWFGKLQEYKAFKIVKDETKKEIWKPLHRGALMNRTDIEIVSKFNAEIRGIYNYYRLAGNVCGLDDFYYIMEGSMLKTFAAKYNTSMNKIIAAYKRNGNFGIDYNTKAGKKRCEFYHDGFARKDISLLGDVDLLPNYKRYDKPNSLAARLKAGTCESCGTKTSDIHMHHVKRLKDLTGKTKFEVLMMEKRRKSLALCPDCFAKTRD
jgi:group II intron reverse transcriptase/maturase